VLRGTGVIVLAALLTSCSGKPPDTLGIRGGRLADCPDKPNCLCSDDRREAHGTDPLVYTGAAAEAWSALRQAVEDYPRTRIVTDTGEYMHAEFTVSIFGFVDDVEFHLRPEQGIIALRSASRLGYSDLGVNRRRIEKLRRTLQDRGVI
jgi:uncharacterized protein (DUF1499 family)